jgi:hypothetical protein
VKLNARQTSMISFFDINALIWAHATTLVLILDHMISK